MSAQDNLSNKQFDVDKFTHLVKPAEEGGEGYLDNILNYDHEKHDWAHRYITMDAPHPWPKNHLKEVTEEDSLPAWEHHNNLQLALKQSGAKDSVTVRRAGKPRQGAINNVSLFSNWAGGGSSRPRATYEWKVPVEDIVSVGKTAEGEVFVKHPKGRQITKVATPIKSPKNKRTKR